MSQAQPPQRPQRPHLPELGALLVGQGAAQKVRRYVDGLCADAVLRRWEG